jgi:hypothetical protein
MLAVEVFAIDQPNKSASVVRVPAYQRDYSAITKRILWCRHGVRSDLAQRKYTRPVRIEFQQATQEIIQGRIKDKTRHSEKSGSVFCAIAMIDTGKWH